MKFPSSSMDSCCFSFWIEIKRKWNVNVYFTLTCDVHSLPPIYVHFILDMNTRNEPNFPNEVWLQFSDDVQFNVIKTTKKK